MAKSPPLESMSFGALGPSIILRAQKKALVWALA